MSAQVANRQVTSRKQFDDWSDRRTLQARSWADRPETQALIDAVLAADPVDRTQAMLNAHRLQIEFRKLFAEVGGLDGLLGYFIITPDGISLGSLRSGNTGTPNLLWQEPEFVERMRSHGAAISPLMTSDVALENSGLLLDGKPLTLFVGVPIYRGGPEPVAYFTIRVPPISLLAVQGRARFGFGGISYLVDRHGRLHADRSWANLDLDEHGLRSESFRGRRYLFARDPGRNLLVGAEPTEDRSTLPLTRSATGIRGQGSGASFDVYRDHRGVDVVGAWQWDDTMGLGIATEIPAAEAYGPIALARQRVTQTAMVVAVLVAVGLLTGLLRLSRQLQAALRASEAASRAKGTFLANMSHEIRTPLNAIIGLTHLMSRDTSDAGQRDRLNKIDGAAQHLLQVINDILDLSKIEAGKLELAHAEFSLDVLVSRVFEIVGEQARARGLELIVDTDHLPQALVGDVMRLSQMLINLLSNAVKFTDRGWVRLSCKVMATEAAQLQIRFEVQDTGVGIPLDKQGSLFRAFEQVDAATTRRFGGTGLGLALTRQFARAMRGDVGVNSEVGRGSTFWFTVWLEQLTSAGVTEVPGMSGGLRALLVDDLPEALSAIGDRLRSLGFDVDPIQDANVALDKVRLESAAGRSYDVMMIDWRMEPLDGIETMRQIRAMLGAATPPSVLITAADDTGMRQLAAQVQYDDVLIKPLTGSALHDALTRVMRRKRAVVAAAPTNNLEAEVRLRRDHAGRRVLLAEDNPVNLEVAQELLSYAGLAVDSAENGALAVELATSSAYDVVLMDMQMPIMDGMAASRAMRDRGIRIPIIAMTANAYADDRQACLDAGMNDHIVKPVDPAQLYSTLVRWLDAGLAAEGPITS